ncbi:thioredoxin domain-containing protein [Candidatus Bathyarchaeota archaeon]|nr:thioredoxin domain-containing protein [Candidatus Bathyarchaeota archaeon]
MPERKVLLVSNQCPFCKVIMKKIREKKLPIDIVNVETKEGKSLVAKYGVKSVPECMVLIQEGNGEQVRFCNGKEAKELVA